MNFNMVFSNVLPETNCNIPMPQNVTKNINNCENCIKNDVCIYSERMKRLNDLSTDLIKNVSESSDEYNELLQIAEVEVKCKKFVSDNYSTVGLRG